MPGTDTIFLISSARGLSWDTANRLPIATASAPNVRAAAKPLPSANPPAATTGVAGNRSDSVRMRTSDVTSPPCAAASWPVHIRASAPESRADCACLAVVIVDKTLPPYECAASAIQSAFPKLTLINGTCSSSATSAFSLAPGMSSVAPMPNALPGARRRISWMHSRVSSAFRGPVAKMPHPPAFDTAATSDGLEIQLMPGSTMGCLHPTS
mmetsp:Transcript_21035/g.49700  ORF Transcript_21035/g.49700 Transcript_21035/m.49700 type:complete len:211 (-) Transcript_21035:84-716(-)